MSSLIFSINTDILMTNILPDNKVHKLKPNQFKIYCDFINCFRYSFYRLGYLYDIRFSNVTKNVWIHSVVNYIPTNESQVTIVYHDGNSQNQIQTILDGFPTPFGPIKDFNITIGRSSTVEVDELYLFNQALTAEEIKILGNLESYP